MMNPSTQHHLLYIHAPGKGANTSIILNKCKFLGVEFLSQEAYYAGKTTSEQWLFDEFVASFSVDIDSAGTLSPNSVVAHMLNHLL
eukprot:1784459-Rhodomonas_salina.1